MQSGIATIKPVSDLDVDPRTNLARLKFDSKKVSMQELIGTVKESGRNFDATLLLHATGKKDAIADARKAILKVKGVTKVSQPDKDGNVRITFDKKGQTMLASIVEAAKNAKVTLKDPKPKKGNLRSMEDPEQRRPGGRASPRAA
ncbi:MAG: heavy-metal-associated domain-containing protein [Armatimonadetes bacterium]|nr:heavy-metal-associated domain-containing protein [Armatimonadota bacterium]